MPTLLYIHKLCSFMGTHNFTALLCICIQVLTVYEMFGRHLFQLPGFSAERAAAVLEVYPTPTQYA